MTLDADGEELLNPGLRRLRERERAHDARANTARAAIRWAGANPPEDLASPRHWETSLGDALDSLLRVEWPDEATSPDGVGRMLVSEGDHNVQVDVELYLLPNGKRRLRLEFDADGDCVIRVAAASESSAAARRLDPHRPMQWDFFISTKQR